MASFKNLISTTSAQIASGGTITGDLVINGDLQVDGGVSLSFDEIVQGTQVIDVDSTTALVVRKNGASGDVLIVDTDNSRVGIGRTPTQKLDIYASSGNQTIMNELGGGGNAELRLKNNAGDRIIRASSDKLQFIDNADSRADLSIDGSGNSTFAGSVGVGASPVSSFPAQNVTIEGATAGLVLRDSTGSNQATQFFTLYSSNGDIIGMFDDSKSLKFGHADDAVGTNYEDVLVITSDNRVGIGTASPDTKLDIVGSDFAGASLKIERTGDG